MNFRKIVLPDDSNNKQIFDRPVMYHYNRHTINTGRQDLPDDQLKPRSDVSSATSSFISLNEPDDSVAHVNFDKGEEAVGALDLRSDSFHADLPSGQQQIIQREDDREIDTVRLPALFQSHMGCEDYKNKNPSQQQNHADITHNEHQNPRRHTQIPQGSHKEIYRRLKLDKCSNQQLPADPKLYN